MRFGFGYGSIAPAWPRPDFEAGLIPDLLIQPGESESGSLFTRDAPGTIAMDFTGLDGSLGGLIFEVGGSNNGAFVGFRADGVMIARCGDGAVPWSSGTGYVVVPAGRVSGDGTLVVSFTPGAALLVRVMWNGGLVGTPVNGAAAAEWTGANTGNYLSTSANLPEGEIGGTVVPYTSASALRYYAGVAA